MCLCFFCLCLYFAKPDWWGHPLNTTGCRARDSNNSHSAKHITICILFRTKHNDHLLEEERVAQIAGKLLTSLLCCELKFSCIMLHIVFTKTWTAVQNPQTSKRTKYCNLHILGSENNCCHNSGFQGFPTTHTLFRSGVSLKMRNRLVEMLLFVHVHCTMCNVHDNFIKSAAASPDRCY